MKEHKEAAIECQRRDSRRASRRASRLFQLTNKENEDGGRRGSRRGSKMNTPGIIKLDSVEEYELDVAAFKAIKER